MKRKVSYYFGENRAHAGLGRESLHGGLAFVAARALNMVAQVATTILLARLLTPRDYGLVAMVLAIVGIAPTLIDFGTTDATVQGKRISHEGVSALFWLKIAIGATFTLLLVGGSGWIAAFYGEPALIEIAVVASLIFVATALSSQHFALMRRAMQFRQMAMIDIASNLLASVIAIVMAVTGWGFWALIAKPILTSGLAAVAAWVSCPWVPGRPRRTAEAGEMIRFGMGVTGFSITDNLAQATDRIALGYFFGAGSLGYFQNSVLLYNNLLNLFAQGLHDVAVSSLSKLRSNLDELKRSWAAALSSLIFFSALAFAGLAVTGQDFVVMLLGPQWEPAGPLVCIFAVRGIAHVTERTLGWLHVAAGRSDRWMRWGFLSAIVQIVAIFAGLPFGMAGVATAHAVATFCLFVPALVYAGQPLGIGAADVLRAVGPQTVAALATVAVGLTIQHLFLGDLSRPVRFGLSGAVCVAVYLGVAVGIFRATGPLRLVFSLARDFGLLRLWRTQ